MYSTEAMNNISIEQFAAFLDGNLPEEDMQQVALSIDADKELSGILADAMQVDESVDEYMNHPDALQADIQNMDFDLPVIPVFAETADEVTLALADSPGSVELIADDDSDIHLAAAAESSDDAAETTCVSPPCDNANAYDGFDSCNDDDNIIDFDDFT